MMGQNSLSANGVSDDRRLYRVTIEYEVYAIGTDERDAIFAAQEGIRHELQDPDATDAFAVTRLNAKAIPPEWRDNCPFGTDNDEGGRTVDEWVDALPALDTTIPLPFGDLS